MQSLTNRFSVPFGLTLAAALFLGCSASASAWWNKDWTIRKKITVDTTAKGGDITGPIGSAVVLIRLPDGAFQFGAAKEDGSDIRFVAEDDKTLLSFHLERYDALMGEAFAWVKLPDVKPAAQTSFWMYYGNAKAEATGDPKATYDADTVLVYHFAERGAPANDSSRNGNNATNAGTPVDGSMVGGGVRLGGAPVSIPPSPTLQWNEGAAVTISAWVKPITLSPGARLVSRLEGNSGFALGLDNGVPFVEVNGQRSASGPAVAINTWHHLTAVAAGGKITLFLDGVEYGALAAGLPALNSPILLGGENESAFTGEMDELEISRVARPAGFVKFGADSEGGEKAAKLLSLGQDEQRHGWFSGGGGTLAVLFGSLTVDGWLVIGILAIMLLVSWGVMVSKTRYLNAVSKGNEEFLRQWRQVAQDLTVLDQADTEGAKSLGGRVDGTRRVIRQGSVYRIYHIGVEEIRHRFDSNPKNSVKVLSAQAIEAIRASLDGGLVREQQRLNDKMVLLTIAISGGPFLGLLGTVIGVMITFAAIAAAGDVNVNAIAPGIAAALLATVAGLAVAIPSLFGYNYLITRIKNATSDMHVFIDEFVAKIAEFYRPRESEYLPRDAGYYDPRMGAETGA